MPIPASWTTVPVTWTLTGHDGAACNGVVLFTATQVVSAGSAGTFVPAPIRAVVTNGVMAATSLPATDDPDATPNGWTWTVTALTVPAGPPAFDILVPAAGGTINLATVVPAVTPAAVAQYVAPTGAGIARFITRARAGGSLKIVGVGDSITAGTGATLGTNDLLTLVKDACDTRFAATITQSNRALSGATTATSAINGYFANAIADAGDLYLIMFGKNDTVADTVAVPQQGYPRANSIRGLEVMIREIRRNVPQADIIVASENPNIASDTAGNANLVLWNAEARQIAGAYGCEWVDIYADWIARGDYSALLSDSVHPSVAGHAAIATVILDHVPTSAPLIPIAPGGAGSVSGIKAVGEVLATTGYNGWRVLGSTDAVQDGVWVNSGTWSGPNPYQTTTAADYAEITFVGTELMVRFSTAAADAAVVDIAIDGVTVHTDLALSALPSSVQPFLLVASGLTLFQHRVKITLKSGTLKIYQIAWLATSLPQPTSTQRKFIGGRYYGSSNFSPATMSLAAGTAWVVPIFIPQLKTLNQLACSVTTGAGSATVTLGIYGADEFDQPLGLLGQSAALDASAAAFVKSAALTIVPTPGWYWLAVLGLGATVSLRCNLIGHDLVTTTAESTASALNGYQVSGLSALPGRWSSTTAGAGSPRLLARFT